jgi:hypothetical protein
MFCSECGQQNEADAKFCSNCGNKFLSAASTPSSSAEQPSSAQMSSNSATLTYAYSELKDSGTVTAMSVIGFVFGLIGMMGSFIPCIGSLAFYIGIPAALISAIGLFIAYSQQAKKTFAIVAVTISLIGVVISGWQYFSIISAGKNIQREMNKMTSGLETKNNTTPNALPVKTEVQPMSPSASSREKSVTSKFCGVWEYTENGSKSYLKITQHGSGKFKFDKGYLYQGKIIWTPPSIKTSPGKYRTSSINLRLINGKLTGKFVSSNFYATHSQDFTYKITLDLKSDNNLLYSVYCSIRGGETEVKEATKINS